MNERNADKVKRLENELGRYKKKVADQQAIIKDQGQRLVEASQGAQELNTAVDGLLIAIALEYGHSITDDDGTVIMGDNLVVPFFVLEDMLNKYQLKCSRTESGGYLVRVVDKEGRENPCESA